MRLGDFDALKETIIKICGKCSNNITEYDENHLPNGNCAIWHILNMIDNAPTVENDFHRGYAQGYVDGRTDAKNTEGTWIYQDFNYTCSNCGKSALEQEDYPFLSSYCPFCGAEMEVEP